MWKSLTHCQRDTVAHGWLVVSQIAPIILMNLRKPDCSTGKYNHPRVVDQSVSVNEEEDKKDVNANVDNNEFLFKHGWIIQKLLILNFKHFLQQPKFKKKTSQEVATSWYSDKVVICVLSSIYKMLPKDSEIPDNADAQTYYAHGHRCLVIL